MSVSGIRIPRSELECSICVEVFVKSLMTKCQHVFCTTCIQVVPSSICPLCNRTFKKEKLVAPLFFFRALNITRPFATFNNETADLLLNLKLVESSEELFLLDAVIETGILVPAAATAIDKFSARAEVTIKKLIASNNDDALNKLFEVIFDLACSDQEKKTLFIPHLLLLLADTKHSLKQGMISSGSLDCVTLIRGFNALKAFLPSRRETSLPSASEILESLIDLANDPEFPLELKSSLFVFIVHYSQNEDQAFNLLAKCAASKHTHPGSLQEMANTLHGFKH